MSGTLLLFALSSLLYVPEAQTQNTNMNPTSIVQTFISTLNWHNLDAIGSLMSDDHTFIDSHSNKVVGKEEAVRAWHSYFKMFLDYRIQVETTMELDDTVAVFGFARGMYHLPPANYWRLPAAWKAVVANGKIKLWQVYADTKIPFDIIAKYSAKPSETLERVTGIGGVFFKAKDPNALKEWYKKHLGLDWAGQSSFGFKWRERNHPDSIGRTELGIFKETTKYFDPSTKEFMLNFRVKNFDELLKKLKSEGVHVEEKVESYEYGKFGWIVDPEGNKIELWEPVDSVLEK